MRGDIFVGTQGPYPRVVIAQEVFDLMDRFAQENGGQEYGGLLLGKARRLKGPQSLEIAIKSFVPLRKDPGVSRFTISTEAYQEAVQKEVEGSNLQVVGWMHTHPGFGVFLSNLDKDEHQRFFGKRYQLAYVIDPENMERAFYWLRNGQWEEIKGYWLSPSSKRPGKLEPTKSRKSRKKRIKSLAIAAFWLLLVSGAVFGYLFIESFNPVQRGKVTIDVNEPLPSSVQMQGTITSIEETLLEATTDDRGIIDTAEYEEYLVKAGDSLWEIAESKLGDASRYQEIVKLNGLTNARIIRPGMVLKIPLDNEPVTNE